MRYPPYGRELARRLAYGSIPTLVHVFAGEDMWDFAKHPSARAGDCHPLVWDGEEYHWPVRKCPVRIQVGFGPNQEAITLLATRLRRNGALGILVWPLSSDICKPMIFLKKAYELELADLRSLIHEGN